MKFLLKCRALFSLYRKWHGATKNGMALGKKGHGAALKLARGNTSLMAGLADDDCDERESRFFA